MKTLRIEVHNDAHERIKPDQIDQIYDMIVAIYGDEPGAKTLKIIGNLSWAQAQAVIACLAITSIHTAQMAFTPSLNKGKSELVDKISALINESLAMKVLDDSPDSSKDQEDN